MKNKFKRCCIILGYILVCFVPLIAYIVNFWKSPISGNPDDWAAFGSYIGGVYSIIVGVLVIYLARIVDSRDKEKQKKKCAIENIYVQLQKIDSSKVDARQVNKLFRLIDENQLFISDKLAKTLTNLANYFLEVKSGTSQVNLERENDIKNKLKELYVE